MWATARDKHASTAKQTDTAKSEYGEWPEDAGAVARARHTRPDDPNRSTPALCHGSWTGDQGQSAAGKELGKTEKYE